MNNVIAKGLEDVLAAVDPNASPGSNNGSGSANDWVGLAATVLPKLLEKSEAREDHFGPENDGVFILRKEVRLLRRQLYKLAQIQKGVLEELSLMRELHSAIVSHLARVQILDIEDDEEIDYEFNGILNEYDYADNLVARTKQRGGGSQGHNRLKKSGRRNPRPR